MMIESVWAHAGNCKYTSKTHEGPFLMLRIQDFEIEEGGGLIPRAGLVMYLTSNTYSEGYIQKSLHRP